MLFFFLVNVNQESNSLI